MKFRTYARRLLAATLTVAASASFAATTSDVAGTWTCTGYNGTWDISAPNATQLDMTWIMPPNPNMSCTASAKAVANTVTITNCTLKSKNQYVKVLMTYIKEGNQESLSGSWNAIGGSFPLMCARVK